MKLIGTDGLRLASGWLISPEGRITIEKWNTKHYSTALGSLRIKGGKIMGEIAERIHSKLRAAFVPLRLEIQDDSAKHSGHSGAREGGESHFSVTIVSDAFAGLSRIARQRLVNQALKDELAGPVHALSLKTLTPDEAD